MYRNGFQGDRRRWVCSVYRREVSRVRYEGLDGLRYNRYLLLNRRVQALARIKRREE